MPLDIFLTIKAEFKPAFLIFMTTPSKAWSLVLSPSLTLTDTTTVSPGLNEGISSFNWLASKDSMICAGVFSSVVTGAASSSSWSSADASSDADASAAGASVAWSSWAGASSATDSSDETSEDSDASTDVSSVEGSSETVSFASTF